MANHSKFTRGIATRVTRVAAILAAAAVCGSISAPAQAQLNLPSAHPGTSISAPTDYHLLFTAAELTQARAQWQNPAANIHASFLTSFNSIKSNANSRAGFALTTTTPSNFERGDRGLHRPGQSPAMADGGRP